MEEFGKNQIYYQVQSLTQVKIEEKDELSYVRRREPYSH